MILFYVGLTILFIGLGSVAWLLFTERKSNQPAEEDVQPIPTETTSQLLSRVGLAEEVAEKDNQPQKKNPFSGLLSQFQKKTDETDMMAIIETEPRMRITKDILQTGTTSIRLNPVTESSPEPTPYISQVSSHLEPTLKEKYEKLDILLKEKAEALEKAEKALAIELKNRKEFNKVKDLLEKELKDDKIKYRDLQVQIGTAQMDATNYKNRVNQLELKVSKLEKTVTEQEHQIKEKDEKVFDQETKLRELTDKLSAKEKLESLKVPTEAPLQIQAVSEPPIPETPVTLPPDILIITPPEPSGAPPEPAPQEKTEPDPNSPTQ